MATTNAETPPSWPLRCVTDPYECRENGRTRCTSALAFVAMNISRGTKVWAFYIACGLALFIIIQGDLLPALLPTKLAQQVGNEGEAVMFAALMAACIQW